MSDANTTDTGGAGGNSNAQSTSPAGGGGNGAGTTGGNATGGDTGHATSKGNTGGSGQGGGEGGGQGNDGNGSERREKIGGDETHGDFKVPDAYAKEKWAEGIKTPEDLWKKLEGSQKLIGKKSIVPDFSKATEVEAAEFFNQLRPADKAEFAKSLKFAEGTPDAEKEMYTDILHSMGTTPERAQAGLEALTEKVEAAKAEMFSAKGMKEMLKKSFGDEDFEGTYKTVSSHIKSNLNAADQKVLENMPNDQLGVMLRYADNVMKAYGASEGSFGAGRPGSVETVADLEKQADGIRAEFKKLDKTPGHSQETRSALNKKLQDVTVKIHKLKGARR